MPNPKTIAFILAFLSATSPNMARAAERAPTARGCIPGPHGPGRMRRMVGQAVTSAWPGAHHPDVDQLPHCTDEEPARDRR